MQQYLFGSATCCRLAEDTLGSQLQKDVICANAVVIMVVVCVLWGGNSMKLCYFMTKREKTNAFIREHQYLALGTGTDYKGTSSPMQWLCRTGNKFQLFGKKGLKLVLNSRCNHVRSLFT